MSTKVITGLVRFSYANVFHPTAINDGDTKKYNCSILIPKSDKKTIAKINAAIESAKEEGKAKLGKAKNIKLPLRDGDEEREDDEAYKGHYFISANSLRKPQIVDENLDEIIDQEDFYSGCYGRASLNFYAFDVSGNKGIAVGLQNLQKLEDGERLSGGSSAADDFSDDDDDMMS